MEKVAAAKRATKRTTEPNAQLRRARELKCWSQEELAERLGTTAFTVCRWERGVTSPGPHFRQKLCALFECGPVELGLLPAHTRPVSPSRARLHDHLAGHLPSLLAGQTVAVPLPSKELIGREPIRATMNSRQEDDRQRMAPDYLSYIEAHAADYTLIEQELPNIDAALALAESSGYSGALVRVAIALAPVLLARGLYAQAEAYLLRAQRDVTPGNDGSAPHIRLYLGRIAELRGQLAAAAQWYDDALRAARTTDDDALIARLLAHRSEVAINRGAYGDVEPWLQEGMQLARARDDRAAQANLLRLLGEARDCGGDFARGDELYRHGLELARESNDLETQASLLQNLGEKAIKRARYEEAEKYLTRGLEAARATRHYQRMSALLTTFAALRSKQQQYLQAEALCQESVQLARKIGHPIRLINALLALGESIGHQRDSDAAEENVREALYLARSIPHPFLAAECLVHLGELQFKQQRVDAAWEAFEEARALSSRAGAHEMEASALYGLARAAACRGDSDTACGHAARSLRYFVAEGHEKADEIKAWLSGYRPAVRSN